MVRKERCGLSSCVSGSLWNRNGGHAASQVALPGPGPRPAPLWTRPAPTMVSRWAALTRVRLCRLCQPSSQRILLVLRLSLYVLCVNLPHLDGFIPLSVISATNTPHHQLWLQNRFRMWEIHTSEPTSWALSVFISLDLPLPWHSVHCDCYIQKRCVFSRQKKPSGGFAKD